MTNQTLFLECSHDSTYKKINIIYHIKQKEKIKYRKRVLHKISCAAIIKLPPKPKEIIQIFLNL